ncbi:S66 family peptidase [Nocardioides pantholopis]|uniref:S66 family peptidase n=1 Tax=Nocardioides pantholopis TaxID=2483798 RepID=UPI000F09A05D|nr:S66 peptidase family protein [Nocardioides pantholopis]
MRFPRPLRPGDTIGVTSPSSGIAPSYLPRLEVAREHLRARGYETRLGECNVVEGGGVTGPARQRAAELTAMLVDPEIRAVVPPWGGELAIQVLEHLDWDAIAAAEPTWLVGFSDLTTLMLPLATRLGWASLHGANLMDTPYAQPDGLAHWLDVLESGGRVAQRSPGRFRSGSWDDWEAEPGVTARDLDTPGRWEVVGGGGIDLTGRLVGGCIEVLAPLVGTPYADVPALGRSLTDDGLLVYLEAAESNAFDIGRALHGMRLAGWFEEANAVLVGRTSAPDSPGYSQREAVVDALGPLDVPLVVDVDFGHVWPYLPMVNGALGHVVVDADRAELTQEWP